MLELYNHDGQSYTQRGRTVVDVSLFIVALIV